MTAKQKVIPDATKKEEKLFFGLPVRIGVLATDTIKVNDRFLVIHGKPSAFVTVVDLETEETAVFHDVSVVSIQSVISLTNNIPKCVDHIGQFTDHFATLSGIQPKKK